MTLDSAKVKLAREQIGFSQAEVAAAVGINRTYYSLFEAGRYLLDSSEQDRLQTFFSSHGEQLATRDKISQSSEQSVAAANLAGRRGDATTDVVSNAMRADSNAWNLWSW